eukprot:TRINITY_DN1692_c0_g1_i1.p1 TRINITY_DN1692_c0_g1~~TRINITY_DN1692_c0_g1_i1.p1  ORF type:complete len:2990 (+),score=801.55 TRINITY_DN1692_c0_g1_i1:149-9118(+)
MQRTSSSALLAEQLRGSLDRAEQTDRRTANLIQLVSQQVTSGGLRSVSKGTADKKKEEEEQTLGPTEAALRKAEEAQKLHVHLPVGSNLRLSKPLAGLGKIVEGRSDFFAELANSVGYEVHRLLRYTLLGFTNPLSAELERKAEQQVTQGLKEVLEHMALYVDKAVVASQQTKPRSDRDSLPTNEEVDGLKEQLDHALHEGETLNEQLIAHQQQALKANQRLLNMRSQYYKDLESQRDRFRTLLLRHLAVIPHNDLKDVTDALSNVRLFNPDEFHDEDTQRAVARKAAAMEADFNVEREALVQESTLHAHEEGIAKMRWALEQKKAKYLVTKLEEIRDAASNGANVVEACKTVLEKAASYDKSEGNSVDRSPASTRFSFASFSGMPGHPLETLQPPEAGTPQVLPPSATGDNSNKVRELLWQLGVANHRTSEAMIGISAVYDLMKQQAEWSKKLPESNENKQFQVMLDNDLQKIAAVKNAVDKHVDTLSDESKKALSQQQRADSAENQVTMWQRKYESLESEHHSLQQESKKLREESDRLRENLQQKTAEVEAAESKIEGLEKLEKHFGSGGKHQTESSAVSKAAKDGNGGWKRDDPQALAAVLKERYAAMLEGAKDEDKISISGQELKAMQTNLLELMEQVKLQKKERESKTAIMNDLEEEVKLVRSRLQEERTKREAAERRRNEAAIAIEDTKNQLVVVEQGASEARQKVAQLHAKSAFRAAKAAKGAGDSQENEESRHKEKPADVEDDKEEIQKTESAKESKPKEIDNVPAEKSSSAVSAAAAASDPVETKKPEITEAGVQAGGQPGRTTLGPHDRHMVLVPQKRSSRRSAARGVDEAQDGFQMHDDDDDSFEIPVEHSNSKSAEETLERNSSSPSVEEPLLDDLKPASFASFKSSSHFTTDAKSTIRSEFLKEGEGPKCPNCTNDLVPDAYFCRSCGVPVEAEGVELSVDEAMQSILAISDEAAEKAKKHAQHIMKTKNQATELLLQLNQAEDGADKKKLTLQVMEASAQLARLNLEADHLSAIDEDDTNEILEAKVAERTKIARTVLQLLLKKQHDTADEEDEDDEIQTIWRTKVLPHISATRHLTDLSKPFLKQEERTMRKTLEVEHRAELRRELAAERQRLRRAWPRVSSAELPSKAKLMKKPLTKSLEAEMALVDESLLEVRTAALAKLDSARLMTYLREIDPMKEVLHWRDLGSEERGEGDARLMDLKDLICSKEVTSFMEVVGTLSKRLLGHQKQYRRLADRLKTALFESDRLRSEVGLWREALLQKNKESAVLWKCHAKWLTRCVAELSRRQVKVSVPKALLSDSFDDRTAEEAFREELSIAGKKKERLASRIVRNQNAVIPWVNEEFSKLRSSCKLKSFAMAESLLPFHHFAHTLQDFLGINELSSAQLTREDVNKTIKGFKDFRKVYFDEDERSKWGDVVGVATKLAQRLRTVFKKNDPEAAQEGLDAAQQIITRVGRRELASRDDYKGIIDEDTEAVEGREQHAFSTLLSKRLKDAGEACDAFDLVDDVTRVLEEQEEPLEGQPDENSDEEGPFGHIVDGEKEEFVRIHRHRNAISLPDHLQDHPVDDIPGLSANQKALLEASETEVHEAKSGTRTTAHVSSLAVASKFGQQLKKRMSARQDSVREDEEDDKDDEEMTENRKDSVREDEEDDKDDEEMTENRKALGTPKAARSQNTRTGRAPENEDNAPTRPGRTARLRAKKKKLDEDGEEAPSEISGKKREPDPAFTKTQEIDGKQLTHEEGHDMKYLIARLEEAYQMNDLDEATELLQLMHELMTGRRTSWRRHRKTVEDGEAEGGASVSDAGQETAEEDDDQEEGTEESSDGEDDEEVDDGEGVESADGNAEKRKSPQKERTEQAAKRTTSSTPRSRAVSEENPEEEDPDEAEEEDDHEDEEDESAEQIDQGGDEKGQLAKPKRRRLANDSKRTKKSAAVKGDTPAVRGDEGEGVEEEEEESEEDEAEQETDETPSRRSEKKPKQKEKKSKPSNGKKEEEEEAEEQAFGKSSDEEKEPPPTETSKLETPEKTQSNSKQDVKRSGSRAPSKELRNGLALRRLSANGGRQVLQGLKRLSSSSRSSQTRLVQAEQTEARSGSRGIDRGDAEPTTQKVPSSSTSFMTNGDGDSATGSDGSPGSPLVDLRAISKRMAGRLMALHEGRIRRRKGKQKPLMESVETQTDRAPPRGVEQGMNTEVSMQQKVVSTQTEVQSVERFENTRRVTTVSGRPTIASGVKFTSDSFDDAESPSTSKNNAGSQDSLQLTGGGILLDKEAVASMLERNAREVMNAKNDEMEDYSEQDLADVLEYAKKKIATATAGQEPAEELQQKPSAQQLLGRSASGQGLSSSAAAARWKKKVRGFSSLLKRVAHGLPADVASALMDDDEEMQKTSAGISLRIGEQATDEQDAKGEQEANLAQRQLIDDPSASDRTVEVVDVMQQCQIVWEEVPREVLNWLKLNLMQRQQAELYCTEWNISDMLYWPEMPLSTRDRLVKEFELFLNEVLQCMKPTKHGVRAGLRQKYRTFRSESPSGDRRTRSSSPPGRNNRGPMAGYEYPLIVGDSWDEVASKLRDPEWLESISGPPRAGHRQVASRGGHLGGHQRRTVDAALGIKFPPTGIFDSEATDQDPYCLGVAQGLGYEMPPGAPLIHGVSGRRWGRQPKIGEPLPEPPPAEPLSAPEQGAEIMARVLEWALRRNMRRWKRIATEQLRNNAQTSIRPDQQRGRNFGSTMPELGIGAAALSKAAGALLPTSPTEKSPEKRRPAARGRSVVDPAIGPTSPAGDRHSLTAQAGAWNLPTPPGPPSFRQAMAPARPRAEDSLKKAEMMQQLAAKTAQAHADQYVGVVAWKYNAPQASSEQTDAAASRPAPPPFETKLPGGLGGTLAADREKAERTAAWTNYLRSQNPDMLAEATHGKAAMIPVLKESQRNLGDELRGTVTTPRSASARGLGSSVPRFPAIAVGVTQANSARLGSRGSGSKTAKQE